MPAFWLALGALLLLTGTAVIARALSRPLNHDEHQFLAPASLFLHHGLIPYRDFPLFHLPNLVFVYAVAEKVFGDPILGAKMLNSFSTIGLLGLICLLAAKLPVPAGARLLLVCAAIVMLLCDPLYLFTSGKTWNHEIPAFFLVAAVVFHLETFRRLPRLGPLLCGLFAGLAVGTRLTYLAPAGAFGLHLLWPGEPWSLRWRRLLIWGAGFTLSMAPSAWCWLQAPEAFLFDNLRFPRLRLLDPDNTRIQKTMNWGRKLRFLGKEVLPRSWPLVAAVVFSFWATRRRGDQPHAHRLFALLVPLAIIGCFAPSRYQYQHFYILSVLLASGVIVILQERQWKERLSPTWALVPVVLVLASVAGAHPRPPGDLGGREMGLKAYAKCLAMVRPEEWFPTRIRHQHEAMSQHLPQHTLILTLGPAEALTGGMDIYPEFATGVFAWRSAPFVAPEKRRVLHFVAPADLEPLYGKHLPAGILTGVEDQEQEKPLLEFARRHGYADILLLKAETLWIAPNGL